MGADFSAVLKVSVKEENGNNVAVTVRLYGPNTDYVINRERELQVIIPSFVVVSCNYIFVVFRIFDFDSCKLLEFCL